MKSKNWRLGWRVIFLGCLVLGYGSVLLPQLEAAEQNIGVVTQLSGEAWLISESGELIPIAEGMELPLGVELKCSGSLTIQFDDGSHLSLAANTAIVILEAGEVMVESGSAEFTTNEGQLVRLKPDDKIKIPAKEEKMEAEVVEGEYVAKKLALPEVVEEPAGPEVIEPASPAN